jgi:hypothetical protein
MNSKHFLLAIALVAACSPAMAVTKPGPDTPPWVPLESEAGMFVFGGGSESGGFDPVGQDGTESGGVGSTGASSESGGVSQSGAESESGGIAEVGSSGESGGIAEVGARVGVPYDPQYGIKYYKW